MPYIGNEPSADFTSLSKQDLTGSSGAFVTLSHAVANAEDVALYINNVRQEPTTSYTTNGTTLSFVDYTVSASDDIYVLFLGKAIQTTVPPDGSVGTAKIANSAVNLTTQVNSVLPVANGGTGASSYNVPAMALLDTVTVSGATSLVEFRDKFNDSYRNFRIIGNNITSNASSDQDHFDVAVARGGSSTYDTDATYGTKITTMSNAHDNWGLGGGFSQTKWRLTHSGYLDASEAVPLQFDMTLYDPKGTTGGGRAFTYWITYYSYHPYYMTSSGTLWKTNNNITAIKFYMSTNSILTGEFRLYGVL